MKIYNIIRILILALAQPEAEFMHRTVLMVYKGTATCRTIKVTNNYHSIQYIL